MNLMIIPLFLGILFDAVPAWAGPTAIFFGIEILIVKAVDQGLSETIAPRGNLTTRERRVIVGGFALGILFLASAVLRAFDAIWLYATLLAGIGQLISGAAAIRFYKKVIYSTREHRIPGSLRSKVKRLLTWIFVMTLIGWFVFIILTRTNFVSGISESVQFTWTVYIFTTSVLGLLFKLRHAGDVLDTKLKTGLILCVAGASIHNIAPLAASLLSYLVGSIAYTIGFWMGALALLRAETNDDRPHGAGNGDINGGL